MKGYPTLYRGVIFVETPVDEGTPVANVSADLSFKLGAQLKNLNNVKDELVQKAAAYGCNCVASFAYGQKSRWLAIDDVAYFGNGVATRLDAAAYQRITQYIQARDAQ